MQIQRGIVFGLHVGAADRTLGILLMIVIIINEETIVMILTVMMKFIVVLVQVLVSKILSFVAAVDAGATVDLGAIVLILIVIPEFITYLNIRHRQTGRTGRCR